MVLVQKWPFFQLFFLGNIGQENVFYDILKRKNAFLGYKNKKFKTSKNPLFSKGVNPLRLFWLRSWNPKKVLAKISRVVTQTMRTADCRLQTVQTVQTVETVQTVQTVQTECYFFYLYLNFVVKFFAVAIRPVTGQGFQNTKWLAVLYFQ